MAVAQYLLLVNAEVDSMEGIIDCGVGLGTEASLLCDAIEKAQSELQQEFGEREERRRQIKFLENGGNPLEIKVGHAASIGVVHSISFTDHHAEEYAICEAKGSFALAASPHGDSLESSGRPEGSLGREPNTADNLLLFDGEDSNIGEERNKRSGKRGNVALSEKCLQINNCHNVKESEDSALFRLGFKRQAYTRRNRSRPSRDSAHVGSADLVNGCSNTSVLPSPLPDYGVPKGSLEEKQTEDIAVSSIANSKSGNTNGNNLAKVSSSDDQLNMELDVVQTYHVHSNVVQSGATEGEIKVKHYDNLPQNDHRNQSSLISAEEVGDHVIPHSSDAVGKNDVSVSTKEIVSTVLAKDASDLHKNTKSDGALRTPDIDSKEHSEFRELNSAHDNNDSCEKSRPVSIDEHVDTKTDPKYVHPNLNFSIHTKGEVELCNRRIDLQSEARPLNNIESIQLNGGLSSKSEKIQENRPDDGSHTINKAVTVTTSLVIPSYELVNTTLPESSTTTSELQNSAANHSKLLKKAHEDAILKEAQTIEEKLRRARELSMPTISLEKRKKCHWDFVLEEMAWLANDFIQERVWKTTAALQVSHWVAYAGRINFEQENMRRKQISVARVLSKAVMHFWHSAEGFQDTVGPPNETHDLNLCKSWKTNGMDAPKNQVRTDDESENPIQILQPGILGYAVGFLTYVKSMSTYPFLSGAPTTPDRTNESRILELSLEDQHSEESLFYTVPPGAMQAYKESVESQWMNSVKTASSLHEEDCEASVCDSIADRSLENTYEEDEGETGSYFFPRSSEGCLSSKHAHRKRKHAASSYEVGYHPSYEHLLEGKSVNQPLIFNGKRPSSSVHVGSVPTRRVRTAIRQRIASPFSVEEAGTIQENCKTDISSADTTSFQEDDSSLHRGSQSRKKLKVESTEDFERQFPFDGCEISSKFKKKKKPKHLGYKSSLSLSKSGVLIVSGKGSVYQQRLPVDSMVKKEQRDHLKRRLEIQHFERYGNIGPYGQHTAKKPKFLKQLPETSSEAFNPISGSMPSPVASQMSNMSSPNKLIRIIANRDRGRKSKTMKMDARQLGCGSPWSTFEDQALVVLVHDMGTNWELISDALNSTLQFKHIFRKPSECKERHKFLMDRSITDGADSAEDSGSSQPYPSTLPGIPKGSARQLFQRLREPMEEDTLKAHLEKIILICQKLHASKSQIASQELKQVIPAHNSHVVALSQVTPNNLSCGTLTPLDLCDAITSSSDALSLQYQGTHTSASPISNYQGPVTPVVPTSSANMSPGSPGVVLGNSLQSPPPSNFPSRFGMPRPVPSPKDDQQRMHQYNHIYSGRNNPQSSMPVPGTSPLGVDRGVRMLSGGNGMGMMCGINRGMAMPRPGFQGASPPGMFNMSSPGNMLSGTSVGMTASVNGNPNGVSGPGNSMFRPRDPSQIIMPGQNMEEHRPMMMEELQLQVPQGNGQSVAPYNSVSVPFSNAAVPPPVQSFPVQQHHQPHQMMQQQHMLGGPHHPGGSHHPHIAATNPSSPHHPPYAMRIAKERQLHQRVIPQQQHPFPSPNDMPLVQNGSREQQPVQPPTSGNPNLTQSQHKHQQQQVLRNPQSGNGTQNPMMKQRQRQQVHQQQPRPQQQQHQAKPMKGIGRGTMMMHQNIPSEASHKGQGFFPGSSVMNTSLAQPSNQAAKMYSRLPPESSKQISSGPSNSENPHHRSAQIHHNHTRFSPQQPPVPPSLPTQNQQHPENHSQQNIQRLPLQQNRQMTSDGNQMTPSMSTVASSSIQWKPETPYDASTVTPTAHLAASPHENLVGKEILVPPMSQRLAPRPFSGNDLVHKPGIGGQWKQPHEQQPQH